MDASYAEIVKVLRDYFDGFYASDVEKLKGFIRNPVKVNPDLPSMPNLGLPEEEIDAVARYLIGRVKPGGSP